MRKIILTAAIFTFMLSAYGWHTELENSCVSALLFDQPSTSQQTFINSQWDSLYPFWARAADNFTVPYDAYVDSVVWWGGYWQGFPPFPLPEDFWIEIYFDSTGFNQPRAEPVYSERVDFTSVELNPFYFQYEATIPSFLAIHGETYWITFMATLTALPCWGNNCSFPPQWGDGQELYFKDSGVYGYLDWTSATVAFSEPFESSFQIFGIEYGIEEDLRTLSQQEHLSLNTHTNGVIDLTFRLLTAGHFKARILDLNGRVVTEILDAQLPAGVTAISHKCHLPNGIYFVEVLTRDLRKVAKIVIVR